MPILPSALIGEMFIMRIFCPVLMITEDITATFTIEDMVTFTTLAKVYSTEYFYHIGKNNYYLFH